MARNFLHLAVRLSLLCGVLFSSLLPAALPTPLWAQDAGDPAPVDISGEMPLAVEDPNATEESQPELEFVTAAEVTETPTTLVSSGVSSFSAPSPGVYWMTESVCPQEPPALAAETPGASDVAPAAVEKANDFVLTRKTYAGLEHRELLRIADPSTGNPWDCDLMYVVMSNVVANQTHVYWIDKRGLVRVPVTASPGDPQEVVDAAWNANRRSQLALVGDYLVGAFNSDTVSGQVTQLANSRLRLRNLATNVSSVLASSALGVNANFNSPDVDTVYAYYKVENDLRRVRLDGTGNALVASDIGVFDSAGRRTFMVPCGQSLCLAANHYLYYVRNLPGGAEIWRHNFEDGQTLRVQNRTSEQRIPALIASSVPGVSLGGPPPALFWVETTHVPDPPPLFGGVTTYALMRAGINQNAAIANLYNRQTTGLENVPTRDFASNGEFLLWVEGAWPAGRIMRIANDAAALPIVNLRVTGYEVTQGIQSDANDVRLVKGRQTWVRVFVQSDGVDVPNVTMRLNASIGTPIFPQTPTQITVKGAPDRDALRDAFLFLLPDAWTQGDSILIGAELNPFQIPFEPAYADNHLGTQQVSFSAAYPMQVNFYEANYAVDDGAGGWIEHNVEDTWSHVDRIMRSYPLAEEGLTVKVSTISGGAELGDHVLRTAPFCMTLAADRRSLCAHKWVVSKLAMMFLQDPYGFLGAGYHYGLIDDGAMFPRGAVVDIGIPIGAGPTGDNVYGYYTTHEIGHMLGRPHPVPNSDDPNTSAEEGCGHSRSDPFFPYPMAQIGPGDGTVRGFDRARPSSSGPRPAVLTDTDSFDVMSYCGDEQLQWPSPYTWELMWRWLRDHSTAAAAWGETDAVAAETLGSEVVALIGSILDGSVSVQEAGLFNTAPTLGVTPGAPWTLRMLGGDDAELVRYPFAADDEGEGGAFAVVVPFVDGTAILQIVDSATSTPRWSRTVSPNAPVVANLTIAAGSSPVTGTVTLAWQASDADGDPLFFDIYHSTDGGTVWQPVMFGLSQTSATVDTNTLSGGVNHFKVAGSDGVHRASATSQPITIAHKPPSIHITTPANGATVAWNTVLPLNAIALDKADGLLSGAALQWTSDGASIGAGASLLTAALTPGEHTLALKATNSAGLSATHAITIFVADELAGGPTQLTATPALVGVHVAAGATAPVQRTLALGYEGLPATLPWSAASNVSWITLGATSGANVPATLAITVSPSGLVAGKVHVGQITITRSGGTQQIVTVPVHLAIGNVHAGAAVAAANAEDTLWLPVVSR